MIFSDEYRVVSCEKNLVTQTIPQRPFSPAARGGNSANRVVRRSDRFYRESRKSPRMEETYSIRVNSRDSRLLFLADS
jgi:hypothetical protein